MEENNGLTPRTKCMNDLLQEIDYADVPQYPEDRKEPQTPWTALSKNPGKSTKLQSQNGLETTEKHESSEDSILSGPSEDHAKIFTTEYWTNTAKSDAINNGKVKGKVSLVEIQRAREDFKNRNSGNNVGLQKPYETTDEDFGLSYSPDVSESLSTVCSQEASEGNAFFKEQARKQQPSSRSDDRNRSQNANVRSYKPQDCRKNEGSLGNGEVSHTKAETARSRNTSRNNPAKASGFQKSSNSAITLNSSSKSDKSESSDDTSSSETTITSSSSEAQPVFTKMPIPKVVNKLAKQAPPKSKEKKESEANEKSKAQQKKQSDAAKDKPKSQFKKVPDSSKAKSKKTKHISDSETESTTSSDTSSLSSSSDSLALKKSKGKDTKPKETNPKDTKPKDIKPKETKPIKGKLQSTKPTKQSKENMEGKDIKKPSTTPAGPDKNALKNTADKPSTTEKKTMDIFAVVGTKSDVKSDDAASDIHTKDVAKDHSKGSVIGMKSEDNFAKSRKSISYGDKSVTGFKSEIKSEKSRKSFSSGGSASKEKATFEREVTPAEGEKTQLQEISNLYYQVKWDLLYCKRARKQLSNPLTMWKKVPELIIPPGLTRPRLKIQYIEKKMKELEEDKKKLGKQKRFLEKAHDMTGPTASVTSTNRKRLMSATENKDRKFKSVLKSIFNTQDSEASSDDPIGEFPSQLEEEELKSVKLRVDTRRTSVSKGHLPYQPSFEYASIAGSSSKEKLKTFEEEDKDLVQKYREAKKAQELFTEAKKRLKMGETYLGVPLPDELVTAAEKEAVLNVALFAANEDLQEVRKKRDEIQRAKVEVKSKLIDRKQKGEPAPLQTETDETKKLKSDSKTKGVDGTDGDDKDVSKKGSKKSLKDTEKDGDANQESEDKNVKQKESEESIPPTSCIGKSERTVRKFYKKQAGRLRETTCATACFTCGGEVKEGASMTSKAVQESIHSRRRSVKKYCREHGGKALEEHPSDRAIVKRCKQTMRRLCEETESDEKEDNDKDKKSDKEASDGESKDKTKEGSKKDAKGDDEAAKDGEEKSKDKPASGKSSKASSSSSEESTESESTSSEQSSSSSSSETETESDTKVKPKPAAKHKPKPAAKDKPKPTVKHKLKPVSLHTTSSEDWPSHSDILAKASNSDVYAAFRQGKRIREGELKPEVSSSGSVSLEEWPSHSKLKDADYFPWDARQEGAARSVGSSREVKSLADACKTVMERGKADRVEDTLLGQVTKQKAEQRDYHQGRKKIKEQTAARESDEDLFETHINKRTTGRIMPGKLYQSPRPHGLVAVSKTHVGRDPSQSLARLRRRSTKTMGSFSLESAGFGARYEASDTVTGLTDVQMCEVTEVVQQTIQAYKQLQKPKEDVSEETEKSKEQRTAMEALLQRVRKLEMQYHKKEISYTLTKQELANTQSELHETKELRKMLQRKLNHVKEKSQNSANDLETVTKQLKTVNELQNRIKILEREDSRKEEEIAIANIQLKHAENIMRGLWREVNNARQNYRHDLRNIQVDKTNTSEGISNILTTIQDKVHGIQENTCDLKHGLHSVLQRQYLQAGPICRAIDEDSEELLPVKTYTYRPPEPLPENRMICDKALDEFRSYKALIEELMLKVYPMPFHFQDRKATLYESTMYLLMFGQALDPTNLPEPGTHLEERITGLQEGNQELQELLALDSLHQICILLKYLGDECLRVLTNAHQRLSGSTMTEASTRADFSTAIWTDPVDDVSLVTYMGRLMVKVNQLVDELVDLKETHYPTRPSWYNSTQQFYLNDPLKRQGPRRKGIHQRRKTLHPDTPCSGLTNLWQGPFSQQMPGFVGYDPNWNPPPLSLYQSTHTDHHSGDTESSPFTPNPVDPCDAVELTYDQGYTQLDGRPWTRREKAQDDGKDSNDDDNKHGDFEVQVTETTTSYKGLDYKPDTLTSYELDAQNTQRIAVCGGTTNKSQEYEADEPTHKRSIVSKLKRRIGMSRYFRNVYS